MNRSRISRRTVLRGAGALVGLPLLEAMLPGSGRSAQAAGAPVRFVAWFHPNGINDDLWTPAADGAAFALTPTLAPLAKVKEYITVISGLKIASGNVGSHQGGQRAFLTGTAQNKAGATDSLDQVIAGVTGSSTRLPSLQLGIEQTNGYYPYSDNNNDGIIDSPTPVFDDAKDYCYGDECRLSIAKGTNLPNFYNPRLVFERIFGAGTVGMTPTGTPTVDRTALLRRNAQRKSVLDHVGQDIGRLQMRLGASDRLRLEEYLTGLRDVEKAIQKTEAPMTSTPTQGCAPGAKPAGMPIDHMQRLRLLTDLTVKAFQCNATRSVTIMLGSNTSQMRFKVGGIEHAHHEASHWAGDDKKRKGKDGIDLMLMTQLAYFLEQMKAVPEPGGTMLDNVVLYMSSDIADPNIHDHQNMPVLLAGRGGGAFKSGRHVRAPNRQTGDLFLNILDAFGIQKTSFGESTGRLTGLS